MNYSIIIPTFNEEKRIVSCIKSIKKSFPNDELIVVDGGSYDETLNKARKQRVKVIGSRLGRAVQMNTGARKARGDVLVFVHADTTLPAKARALIRGTISGGAIAGGFEKKFDSTSLLLKINAYWSSKRSKYTGIVLGDQALFVIRDVFWKVGGFPIVSVMEDVLFSKSIRGEGKLKVLPCKVVTSSRRFDGGILKTLLLMALLRSMLAIGVKQSILAKLYEKKRIILMAKWPEPGKVKTRLARDIGYDSAAKVQMWCLEKTKKWVYHFDTVVYASSGVKKFEKLYGLPVKKQAGVILGERMKNAFKEIGGGVMVGSDIPGISRKVLNYAFWALKKTDVVIGPCFDGGFYLIGMNETHNVLDDVRWSTPFALEDVVRNIKSRGLKCKVLKKLRDIDTIEDLRALRKGKNFYSELRM